MDVAAGHHDTHKVGVCLSADLTSRKHGCSWAKDCREHWRRVAAAALSVVQPITRSHRTFVEIQLERLAHNVGCGTGNQSPDFWREMEGVNGYVYQVAVLSYHLGHDFC